MFIFSEDIRKKATPMFYKLQLLKNWPYREILCTADWKTKNIISSVKIFEKMEKKD